MDYDFAGRQHDRFNELLPRAIQEAEHLRDVMGDEKAARSAAEVRASLEIEHLPEIFDESEEDALACVLEQGIREHFENERGA